MITFAFSLQQKNLEYLDNLETITKSYQDAPAMKWSCDGSPSYTLEETEKAERGTDIVMHIDDENYGENVICQVFQQGFKMGEKVIRFAMVQVAN